jgi:predicted ATP-grasp superfamily ATP-dependent carboligase
MSVIVTDAALRTGLFTIRSLGRKGISITAVEKKAPISLNLGFHSRYATNKITIHDVIYEENHFLDDLVKLLNGHEVLFPISIYSIEAIAANIKRFENNIKLVPLAPYETIQSLNINTSLLEICKDLNIPFPKTYFPDSLHLVKTIAKKLQYPVYIKVQQEADLSPSQRNEIAFGPNELIKKYKNLHKIQPYPLIQEKIEGSGCGYFTIYNQGESRITFCHKRIREYPTKGGPSSCCISWYDEKLVEYGRRLLDAVNWNGLAMIEFKYDIRDGLPKVMEVNPRMWGSIPLATICGIDFPYCLYKIAVEGDIKPQHTYPVGVKMRFFYEDLAASVSYLIKGGANRTLFYHFLKDLLDFRIRDGIFQLDDLKPAWSNTLKALTRVMGN